MIQKKLLLKGQIAIVFMIGVGVIFTVVPLFFIFAFFGDSRAYQDRKHQLD